jgi:hypothetical protein
MRKDIRERADSQKVRDNGNVIISELSMTNSRGENARRMRARLDSADPFRNQDRIKIESGSRENI